MKYATDSFKNTYKINEYLLNEEQGKILQDLNRWFFDKTVLLGFLLLSIYSISLYVLVHLKYSMNIWKYGSISTGLICLFVLVILFRVLEMRVKYIKLKKTFNTHEEFLYFLNVLAYNRYTIIASVSFESVELDFNKIKNGHPKIFFFFKYLYLLNVGQKAFLNYSSKDNNVHF